MSDQSKSQISLNWYYFQSVIKHLINCISVLNLEYKLKIYEVYFKL